MMMSDTEVHDQVRRADRFREAVRNAISETVVDPASLCATEARAGLARIAATLDAVPYVTTCNLANLDLAMKRRVGTGLMSVIEIHLLAVGGGPELDFESATEFLAQFEPIIDLARRRKIN
jgi:hypothetical protein